MKVDMALNADTMAARRKSCGYHVQLTCASCDHCERTFHAKGHAAKMMAANCDLHKFSVNLDRGICDDFKIWWKEQSAKARTERAKQSALRNSH